MSMIKCPECGQRVSSMAGTCPHCGVRIAGNIRECTNCGKILTKAQTVCPDCHTELPAEADEEPAPIQENREADCRRQRKGCWGKTLAWLLTLLILAAATVAGLYYFDLQRKADREEKDYIRLAKVSNPEFYRQFLADYPESGHRDEVTKRMTALQQEKDDWEKALHENTREGYRAFGAKYPRSARKRVCESKTDSIDWAEAVEENSYEAVCRYLKAHPEGCYVSEAAEKRDGMARGKVTEEDRTAAAARLAHLFAKGIGKRDSAQVAAVIPGKMKNFCGIKDATPGQIAGFGKEKAEKGAAAPDYAVSDIYLRKVAVSDSSLGFSADFTLTETVKRSGIKPASTKKYKGNATLDMQHRITSMNLR